MGSYGIGPARIVAAAIEQGADERGHRLAARDRALGGPPRLARQGRRRGRARGGRRASTRSCARPGVEVVYDDRDAGPGEKLTDAELLGCPLRIVVGRRGLAEGVVEAQVRRSGAERPARRGRGGRAARAELLDGLRADADATEQAPPLRPRPLRPEAAADAARAAAPSADDPQPRRLRAPGGDPGLPLPRARLRRRPDGCVGDPLLAIAAGDYLDGFLARVTGQYSRMGALLDPLVDRLTILAGAVVCWHFELLPRWALALLAAARAGDAGRSPSSALRRGRRPRDQLGRGGSSVLLTMGGIFLALVDCRLDRAGAVLRRACVGSLLATVLYAPHGPRAPCARAGASEPRRRRGNIPAWLNLNLTFARHAYNRPGGHTTRGSARWRTPFPISAP